VGPSGRQEGYTSDGGRWKNETLRRLQFWSVYEPGAPEVGKYVGRGLASANGEGHRKDRGMHYRAQSDQACLVEPLRKNRRGENRKVGRKRIQVPRKEKKKINGGRLVANAQQRRAF
jgi:hypothetical protein